MHRADCASGVPALGVDPGISVSNFWYRAIVKPLRAGTALLGACLESIKYRREPALMGARGEKSMPPVDDGYRADQGNQAVAVMPIIRGRPKDFMDLLGHTYVHFFELTCEACEDLPGTYSKGPVLGTFDSIKNAAPDKDGLRTVFYVQAVCDAISRYTDEQVPIELFDPRQSKFFEDSGVVWSADITSARALDDYIHRANELLSVPPAPQHASVVPVAPERAGRALGPFEPETLELLDFSGYIEEKTRHFVGRASLITEVEEFLNPLENQARRGYFVVVAEPGWGKSAFMANLVEEFGIRLHYFNRRPIGLTHTEDFIHDLCLRILTTYNLFDEPLPRRFNTGQHLLDVLKLVTRRAGFNPAQDSIQIVIDSLDEAEAAPVGQNTLCLPTELPEGVYIVLSTRPTQLDEDTPFRLRVSDDTPIRTRIVDGLDNATWNTEDFLEYFSTRAHNEASIGELIATPQWQSYLEDNVSTSWEEFIEEHCNPLFLASGRIPEALADASKRLAMLLTEKSEQNFMYASRVADELAKGEDGIYVDPDARKLPDGLNAYYGQHWEIVFESEPEQWDRRNYPVITGLLGFHRPTGAEMMKMFAIEWNPDITDFDVQRALAHWRQFLSVTGPPDHHLYSFYHASFQDFLLSKLSKDALRDVREAHVKQFNLDEPGPRDDLIEMLTGDDQDAS